VTGSGIARPAEHLSDVTAAFPAAVLLRVRGADILGAVSARRADLSSPHPDA
jgi:hypothetical protein